MRKINVLSLADGLWTGQVALHKANISYNFYIASEINKYSKAVANHNFPATIQIGDMRKIDVRKFPFKIDLLLSGTPCQGFSLAGKQLNFADPRSQLFFEFARILRDIRKYNNPDVDFLFENVRMNKDSLKIISTTLGVGWIYLDSELVSAQTRKRYYWTSIPDVEMPEDRGLYLKDFIQSPEEVGEKYYLSADSLARITSLSKLKDKQKSRAIIASVGSPTDREFFKKNQGQLVLEDKLVLNNKGELRQIDKVSCIDANYHKGLDNHAQRTYVAHGNNKPDDIVVHNMQQRNGKGIGGKGHLKRCPGNKAYCLDTANGQAIELDYRIRRLTPIEAERLQGLPDGFTAVNGAISDTQRYIMLGEGWQADTIAHILSFYKVTL